MRKVYISGKITGLTKREYEKLFGEAEKKIRTFGLIPINPVKKNGEVPGWKWEDYMKRDIQLLCDCDFIYRLPNWQESKGAKLENDLAKTLGIPVLDIFN